MEKAWHPFTCKLENHNHHPTTESQFPTATALPIRNFPAKARRRGKPGRAWRWRRPGCQTTARRRLGLSGWILPELHITTVQKYEYMTRERLISPWSDTCITYLPVRIVTLAQSEVKQSKCFTTDKGGGYRDERTLQQRPKQDSWSAEHERKLACVDQAWNGYLLATRRSSWLSLIRHVPRHRHGRWSVPLVPFPQPSAGKVQRRICCPVRPNTSSHVSGAKRKRR